MPCSLSKQRPFPKHLHACIGDADSTYSAAVTIHWYHEIGIVPYSISLSQFAPRPSPIPTHVESVTLFSHIASLQPSQQQNTGRWVRRQEHLLSENYMALLFLLPSGHTTPHLTPLSGCLHGAYLWLLLAQNEACPTIWIGECATVPVRSWVWAGT